MPNGKIFQVVAKKKGHHFESVIVLSIFCSNNIVISKRNVFALNLSLISLLVIAKVGGPWHRHNTPLFEYAID